MDDHEKKSYASRDSDIYDRIIKGYYDIEKFEPTNQEAYENWMRELKSGGLRLSERLPNAEHHLRQVFRAGRASAFAEVEQKAEKESKENDFPVGVFLVIIFLVGALIGSWVKGCTEGEPDCSKQVTQRAQEQAIDMFKAMSLNFYDYGVAFPEYPFGDPEVCIGGGFEVKKGSPEETDISVMLDTIRGLKPRTGYYARYTYNNAFDRVRLRMVARLSERVVLYMSTYSGEPNKVLELGITKLCVITDNNCVNGIANEFIEN